MTGKCHPLPGYPNVLIRSQNMYVSVCYDYPCLGRILYGELCFTILQSQTHVEARGCVQTSTVLFTCKW